MSLNFHKASEPLPKAYAPRNQWDSPNGILLGVFLGFCALSALAYGLGWLYLWWHTWRFRCKHRAEFKAQDAFWADWQREIDEAREKRESAGEG